jgi:hypothetical protein
LGKQDTGQTACFIIIYEYPDASGLFPAASASRCSCKVCNLNGYTLAVLLSSFPEKGCETTKAAIGTGKSLRLQEQKGATSGN